VEEWVGGAWTPRAAKPTDADALLQEQLHMAAEQFHQIVVLPQGDFARFLRASPEDRRALLEQLFAMERFTDVERILKADADACGAAIAGVTARARLALAVAARVADVPPPEEDVPLGAAVEWLRTLVATAHERATRAASAERTARHAHDAAKRAAADASERHDRQRRHADATRARRELDGRAAEQAARRDALAAAHRAAPVEPLVALLAREQEAGQATGARVAAAEQALATAAPDLAGASSAALRSRAEELIGELHRVDELSRTEARLAARECELADLDRAVEAAAAGLAELRTDRERLPAERADLEARLQAAGQAEAALPGRRDDVERLRARHDAAVRREELEALVRERAGRTRARKDVEQNRYARWLDLQRAQLAAQAAALAARLVAGEPCPVCGSDAHPKPATAAAPVVTEDDLDTAREDHEAARRDADAATDALAALEARLAAAAATAGTEPVPQLAAALAEREQEVAELADRAGAARAARARLRAVDARTRELDESIDALSATLAEARERRSTLDGSLTGERARVVAGRGGYDSLVQRRAAVVDERDAIEEVVSARADADRAHATAAAARERATSTARRQGFPDLAAARAAVLPRAAVDELDAACRHHDTRVAEVDAELRRPELRAAASLPAVDVDAVSEAAATAETAWNDASKAANDAGNAVAVLEEQLLEATDALAALDPLAAEYERKRALADLANGDDRRVEGRMRLSTYVLASRLEQVAAAASERLRRMSGDRYTIVHTDVEADARRKGGLGLRVVDAWTSTERDPSSLSGGEAFFTSLALALGVADVVRAEAGGIEMETMFIDEGFGSLDDETLHSVLDVLDGLRAGGRAIGIVSHVCDLRSRVTAQLEVVKGSRGSTIRAA
jgi:exonuclease SbcC